MNAHLFIDDDARPSSEFRDRNDDGYLYFPGRRIALFQNKARERGAREREKKGNKFL